MTQRFWRGFLTGLGILLALIVVLIVIMLQFPMLEQSEAFTLVPTLLVIIGEFYLIKKTKLPQSYYLIAVLFNVLFLPFLIGIIEYEKKKEK